MSILLSLAGGLLVCFVLFAAASDPGSAASASTRIEAKARARTIPIRGAPVRNNHCPPPANRRAWHESKSSAGVLDDGIDDDDSLSQPLLDKDYLSAEGSTTMMQTTLNGGLQDDVYGVMTDPGEQNGRHDAVVVSDKVVGRVSSDASVHTVNLDGGDGEERDEETAKPPSRRGAQQQRQRQRQQHSAPQRPAVLRWSELSYHIRAQGQSAADAKMTILKGVSGFAGPEPLATAEPEPDTSLDQDAANDCEENRTDQTPSNDRGTVPAAAASHHRSALSLSNVPSTMTGILGPSGAGKSSLLDLLAGRKRKGEGVSSGRLSLVLESESGGGGRGRRVGGAAAVGTEAVRRVAGYVPQEDVLPGTLSCYEHLMFHARLRMPAEASYEDRRARVLWVIEMLGLSRVADSRIGDELTRGLSGGERRRLSIAAELVARPALLFLDEPTTGLGETLRSHLLLGIVESGVSRLHTSLIFPCRMLGHGSSRLWCAFCFCACCPSAD